MRGSNNSLMTRIQERKPFVAQNPCLLHVLSICEKAAFTCIPKEVEAFYRNVYSYFASSPKRTTEFYDMQKKLCIDTELITQPSHTRWMTWSKTISRIVKKWIALVEYFRNKGNEQGFFLHRVFQGKVGFTLKF